MSNELPLPFVRLKKEDLDRDDVVHFHCGDEPWHKEVATYLTSGLAWKERDSARTYLFRPLENSDEVVGFATIGRKNQRYPDLDSSQTIKCLVIAWIAVSSRWQRRGHARTMIILLARYALENSYDAILLFVHRQNAQAIVLYERMSFSLFLADSPYVDVDGQAYDRMLLFL